MDYQIPRVTKAVKYLLIVYGVMILLSIFISAIPANLSLYFQGTQSFDLTLVYRVFTYTFVGTAMDSIGFLFFALVLWWVGSSLESQWGTRSFLVFLGVTVPVSGILSLLIVNAFNIGIPIMGTLGLTFAMIAVFAFLAPETSFYIFGMFPLKAKWLVLISIVLTFLTPSPAYILYALVMQVVAGIVAVVFVGIKFPLPLWLGSLLSSFAIKARHTNRNERKNLKIFRRPQDTGRDNGRKPDRREFDASTKKQAEDEIKKMMDQIYKKAKDKYKE